MFWMAVQVVLGYKIQKRMKLKHLGATIDETENTDLEISDIISKLSALNKMLCS